MGLDLGIKVMRQYGQPS